jgi:UDP-N-acetylmuramoyl-tripeptide--D-alanyl-D-alanine ligase
MRDAVIGRPVLWTAGDAAAAVGGDGGLPGHETAVGGAGGLGPWQATGVSIDSRTVTPGDLFVALRGPSFDGHDFVARAFAAGAVAALVSRQPPGLTASDGALLMVPDTLTALADLGRAARARSRARVIAVTGSVGKTGVKEALATCLAGQGATYATAGNLNNHWGVPLSLSRLPASCRFAVFELGMNHAGEIGPLARLVRPDVGVITTIEPAHMEFFASLAAVADAKAELFEGMTASGIAVLNRDNGQFERLAAAARFRGIGAIRGFGGHPGAEARVLECAMDADGSVVVAEIRGEPVTYRVSLPGRHWVINSLAVLLAAEAAGADLSTAAGCLGHLAPVRGRGSRRRFPLTQGSFTLIDESYNASPAAMVAAFQVLAQTDPESHGRRIAVLGDMLELGEQADAFHAGLAGPLTAAGADLVFCCGPHSAALLPHLPAARRGGWTADSAGLAPLVAAAVRDGDVVLVKGSAGSRMARVVAALAGLAGEAGPVPAAGVPSLPAACAALVA